MAIIDIFKRKKKVEKPEEAEKPAEVKVEKKVKKKRKRKLPEKTEVKTEIPKPKAKISDTSTAYQVLKAPHVTEKATDLTEKNQYIFRIWPRTNKPEIKKAIEDLYGVDVTSVKIIRTPRKKRRLGKISGWRKGYKKAIVKLKEGQKIEVLPR